MYLTLAWIYYTYAHHPHTHIARMEWTTWLGNQQLDLSALWHLAVLLCSLYVQEVSKLLKYTRSMYSIPAFLSTILFCWFQTGKLVINKQNTANVSACTHTTETFLIVWIITNYCTHGQNYIPAVNKVLTLPFQNLQNCFKTWPSLNRRNIVITIQACSILYH